MPIYKFKRGLKVGALSAEADGPMLRAAFLDTGYREALADPQSPAFLVLGRTGSGKSALLDSIERSSQYKTSRIDPEALSLRYLQNSATLRQLRENGANFDLFYKYLWKHVCVLALIKLRYDRTSFSDFLSHLPYNKKHDAKDAALEYLKQYEQEYWIGTDVQIKHVVEEVEQRVKKDTKLSLDVSSKTASASMSAGAGANKQVEATTKTKTDKEITERFKELVQSYQIEALNSVVAQLGKFAFDDTKKRYFLVIDDLDRDWAPDDAMYIDLLKALLHAVRDVNRKLASAKIIVALRENIFYRMFAKAGAREPQREKWADVLQDIHWQPAQLEEMINLRLAEVFRGQYTQAPPRISDLLPHADKQTRKTGWDYLLDRTFLRPRDVIQFVNVIIDGRTEVDRLTWTDVRKAELSYSKDRLNSVFDEWKDSYFGLHNSFEIVARLPNKFEATAFDEDMVLSVLSKPDASSCPWLSGIARDLSANSITSIEARNEILRALVHVGILGVKHHGIDDIIFSYKSNYQPLTAEVIQNARFQVHRMFWAAFGKL